MDNKYFDMFMDESSIDDSILEEKLANRTFEDHFWHLACLVMYYKNKKDEYLEKVCLGKLTDLNYAYSAMLYFDKCEVLPSKYKQYLVPFKESMRNTKLEDRITYFNKHDKSTNFKDFLLYSLSTLSVVPLMLLLILVFHLDTKITMIISIAFLLGLQFLVNPSTLKLRRMRKMNMNSSVISNQLKNYLSYYDRFAVLFQNELYVDLIKAKKEEKRQEIIEKIKKTM